jgi:hypothetical protein
LAATTHSPIVPNQNAISPGKTMIGFKQIEFFDRTATPALRVIPL